MATVQVSLPDPVQEWVDTQVKDGGYATAADYIHDLIRDERSRLETLQAAIDEGMASGSSSLSVEDIVSAAKARLRHG